MLFIYEWKLGHNAAEATRNTKATFGYNSVSGRTVRHWFSKFHSQNKSLQSKVYAPTVHNNNLKTMVEARPCKSAGEFTRKLHVSARTLSNH